MTSGPTASATSVSDDMLSCEKIHAEQSLPRLKQHVAKVTRDENFYVIEFEDDGPVTQGRSRTEALHMAEDVLACQTDRHPDNFNAKFLAKDCLVVWELVRDWPV